VHNPKLAKAAGPLGAHFQPGNYSLTEREREIAVCIINSKWHSAYLTNAHERRGQRWFDAEFLRIKGELLLLRDGAEIEAVQCFREAMEMARQQSAKSCELRATTSLASFLTPARPSRRGTRNARRNLQLVH
jgi:hypothetical protein